MIEGRRVDKDWYHRFTKDINKNTVVRKTAGGVFILKIFA